MKVVLLAGGYGTRISEESHLKPKPMIEIGNMPMIWHIMKLYSSYGFNEFIICAGYKQEYIKKWFNDYFLHTSDITFDFTNNNEMIIHNKNAEPWKVTVVDTGLDTMTGGRIKRIKEYVNDEPFLLTYGDGIADVNIKEVVEYHHSHGKIGTVTVYNFSQSKGVLEINDNGEVIAFREKSDLDGDLINIGFMVMNPEIFDYIEGDNTPFEYEPMRNLVKNGQLMSYLHKGYWQCMDTIREKEKIEALWNSGKAPWKVWKK